MKLNNRLLKIEAYRPKINWPNNIEMPITQDKQLEQLKTTIAFGGLSDNKNGGEFGTAKKLDSMQNPSSRIRADSLLIARFS